MNPSPPSFLAGVLPFGGSARSMMSSKALAVVLFVSLATGLSSCRGADRLQVQEADARLRTCVGWMEGIAGWAIVNRTEPENPGQPGADWRALVAQPEAYYAEIAAAVSTGTYLDVAEAGRAPNTFRSNRREFRAGCPAAEPRP